MQKLVMPFLRQMMLCGYKNAEYKKYWGYAHYGIDLPTIQGGAGTNSTVNPSFVLHIGAPGKGVAFG